MIQAILGASVLSLSVRMIDLVEIIWLADQNDVVSLEHKWGCRRQSAEQ